jgi:hypothetical protein
MAALRLEAEVGNQQLRMAANGQEQHHYFVKNVVRHIVSALMANKAVPVRFTVIRPTPLTPIIIQPILCDQIVKTGVLTQICGILHEHWNKPLFSLQVIVDQRVNYWFGDTDPSAAAYGLPRI